MLKYAVIGSNGYIGRHLCAAFKARGIEVIEISSTNGGIDPSSGLFSADFKLPQEIEAVYFLAQSPHYRDVPKYADHLLSVNCVAAVQAATAAAQAGVKNFIYASTGNVYRPSFETITETSDTRRDAWYPLSKLIAEDALRLFQPEMHIVSARIFGVYGRNQKNKLIPSLISSIRERKPIVIERNPNDAKDMDGLKLSFMYIDDLVKAMISLADHPSLAETVNLAGDRAYSIREVAEIIGKHLGIKPRIEMTDNIRQGDWIADTSLMKTLLDINMTDIETGITKTLDIGRD